MRGQRWGAMVALAMAGCGGTSPDDTSPDTVPQGGACGEVTTWDVQVIGLVEDALGNPVEGADVLLEERDWTFGDTFGNALTDAQGRFEFEARDVVSVEGCWGTALDYKLVVVKGTKTLEEDVNSNLFTAIDQGDLIADLTAFPLVLE